MDADIASHHSDLRIFRHVVVNIVFLLGIYVVLQHHTTVGSTFAKRRALPEMRVVSMAYRAALVGIHNGCQAVRDAVVMDA